MDDVFDKTDGQYLSEFEPIFGWVVPSMPYSEECYRLRLKIIDKYGKEGGILMDYATGKITVSQYIMMCDLRGEIDYGEDFLKEIVRLWGLDYDSLIGFGHSSEQVSHGIDLIKARTMTLKREVLELSRRTIDKI